MPAMRMLDAAAVRALPGDRWAGHIVLTRLDGPHGRLVYEGPGVLHLTRRPVPPNGSRRHARPGDPVQLVLIAVEGRDWAEYAVGHDLQGDGTLINEDYAMSLFVEDGAHG